MLYNSHMLSFDFIQTGSLNFPALSGVPHKIVSPKHPSRRFSAHIFAGSIATNSLGKNPHNRPTDHGTVFLILQ